MPSLSLFLAFYYCFAYTAGVSTGSTPIEFIASPSSVTNGLTESLSLRCSLNRAGLVADASKANQEEDRVVSIIINREVNNKSLAIASVTSFDSPVLHWNEDRLSVKGNISSCNFTIPQKEVFLELTRNYPSTDDSGTFECEMSILSPSHRQTTHYSSLNLKITSPSQKDLVENLVSVKMASSRLQANVFKLQEQLQNTEYQLAQVSQQSSMRAESGTVELQKGTAGMYTTVIRGTVTYNQTFQQVPQTVASIIDLSSMSAQSSVSLTVYNKTVSGFDLDATLGDTYRYQRMEVSWLSVGF